MSSPRLPEDAKPAGNLFFTPGTKTPRKVQWLDKDQRSNLHGLDEHGLDPGAFQRLTNALKQRGTSTPVGIHHYPPQPDPAHTMDIGGAVSRFFSRMLDNPHTTGIYESQSSSTPFSPHYVPGNFIDSTENAGLPGGNNSESHAKDEAERVVRSLTRRRLFRLGSKSKRGKKKAKGERPGKGAETPGSHDSTDIERDAGFISNQISGGILSALLSLYDQDDTAPASGLSTPGRSLLNDPPERLRVHPKEDYHRRSPVEEQHHDRPPSTLATEMTSPSPLESFSDIEQKKKHKARFSPQSILSRRKMSKARSGAGVLGPPIASTRNLISFAAPTQSQLQPDIRRLEYKLSRYSLDENSYKRPSGGSLSRSQSMFDDSISLPGTGTSTPGPSSPPSPTKTDPGPDAYQNKWTGVLKDLPYIGSVRNSNGRSGVNTPARSTLLTTESDSYFDMKRPSEDEKKGGGRRGRGEAQIFITRHVAKIIERQDFVMKLGRAMMMFGGPSHRLQSQIKSTAHVLDIELSCVYFPDVLLLSFDDSSTGTSSVKFIRQESSLDLGKLMDAYSLYWKVIHDKLYVSDASAELDVLMLRPQLYNWWRLILIGGMCSASICTVSFGGSFLDAVVVFPLGALLVMIQLLSVRNELYSNVFEVTVATLFSFVAAALASSRHFCYSAVASSSVVLILPGFIVLCGSLEIMSRNIVAGSVRLCYAVVYALFLGFGLAMGAMAFEEITGTKIVGSEDIVCTISHHPDGPWYQRTPSDWWSFLTVPMYSLFLSLRIQAPYDRRELALLVIISCIGWVSNYFTGIVFANQSDITGAVGAFAVGIVSNLYARFFGGNAFVIMITGILFQVPSGLGSDGLLHYVSQQKAGSATSYLTGFETALKLVSVAIGLTIGLGISLVLIHPIQSKRRAGGIFSL